MIPRSDDPKQNAAQEKQNSFVKKGTARQKPELAEVLAHWLPFFFALGLVLVLFYMVSNISSLSELFGSFTFMLSPVLYGLAFGYLCNPLNTQLKKGLDHLFFRKKGETPLRAKLSKGLSIAGTLLILLAILFIFGYIVFPGIYQSISSLIQSLPGKLTDGVKWMQSMNLDTSWAGTFESSFIKILTDLQNYMEKAIPNAMSSVVTAVANSLVSVIYQLVSLIIGLVVMIYVLSEKAQLARQGKMILYAMFEPERANDILRAARHGNRIFSGFLSGKLLESLLIGAICVVFMLIFRMPFVLLIGFIVGVTNIVPYFGPFVGGFISTLLVFLNNPRQGLIFLIFVIVLQQIDGNILGPKILGNTTGISTFWVTVSLLFFGWMFGVTGMILGVPLFAVLYYLINRTVSKRLLRRDLPNKSAAWTDIYLVDPDTGEPVHGPLPEDEEEQLLLTVTPPEKKSFSFWKKRKADTKPDDPEKDGRDDQ